MKVEIYCVNGSKFEMVDILEKEKGISFNLVHAKGTYCDEVIDCKQKNIRLQGYIGD